ncbi:MAG: threonylcarbamoyl-AMP synthase [Clostridia bacterium]|nr:threonylcarbamoyl-AMP synthase [Clostridia bacterium]
MYENHLNNIIEASKVIQSGGLVLFPTETVYGIGANALKDDAVEKIFEAKGRAQDNPLILHISDMDMLPMIAKNISELEYRLMDAFWPGPFTIILNKKPGIAKAATCGGDTVGVRMPNNKIAHDLIKCANVPIAAPSANISGRPSGTKLEDILEELRDKVNYIIDGGECDIGLESTVVRVTGDEVKILRPGKITKEDIQKIVDDVEVDKNVMGQLEEGERVLSPGMKYRHYAPNTKCTLVYSEDSDKIVKEILKIAKQYKKVLILTSDENADNYKEYECIKVGSNKNLPQISHNIFSILRKIDSYHVEKAIIEGVKPEGLGLAIMNRLIRACEHDYLQL